MKSRIAFGIAVLSCAITASRVSAQIIDQQQTNVAALGLGRLGSDACWPQLPSCNSNGWYTQSFIPTLGTSAGAAFMLQPLTGVSSGTLTVQLWNAAPQAVGATMLASGTSALGAAQQFYTTFFTSTAAVTAGNTYFLAFWADAKYNVRGDYGTSYANGSLNWNYTNNATDIERSNGCCDAAFIEYATGPSSTVPEPATVSLMAAGLLAIVSVGRPKNKK